MKHSYLKRNTPLVAENRARRTKTSAEDFGERGEAVRAMPCLVAAKHGEGQASPSALIRARLEEGYPALALACLGAVQAAHINGSRGAGYNRRSLGPLCAWHHEQSGERGRPHERSTKRKRFEALYDLDLSAAAERIAIELDEAGLL